MDIFELINEFFKARNFPETQKAFQTALSSGTYSKSGAQGLQSLILKELQEEEPEIKQGISDENEAIMETLMSKLIVSPTVVRSQPHDSSIERLLEIKAFQKMVACADQLFFDENSMNISAANSSLKHAQQSVKAEENSVSREESVEKGH